MDLIAKAVTLKSIKLNDPAAKNLLFSSKHSVLYSFSTKTNSWEKTETEGCLAIYKRNEAARNVAVLFILNRLRPENFSCPLAEIESVQLEGDLLMLLLKNTQVMGIWLFDEKERQLALNVLDDLLQGEENDGIPLSDSSTEPSSESVQQLKHISVTDLLGVKKLEKSPSILDLLSKAQVKESPSPSPSVSSSLDKTIFEHFCETEPVSPSLKSFTESVCEFIRANPQLLAPLHRQLTDHKQ